VCRVRIGKEESFPPRPRRRSRRTVGADMSQAVPAAPGRCVDSPRACSLRFSAGQRLPLRPACFPPSEAGLFSTLPPCMLRAGRCAQYRRETTSGVPLVQARDHPAASCTDGGREVLPASVSLLPRETSALHHALRARRRIPVCACGRSSAGVTLVLTGDCLPATVEGAAGDGGCPSLCACCAAPSCVFAALLGILRRFLW
jgi:hypothetical protein